MPLPPGPIPQHPLRRCAINCREKWQILGCVSSDEGAARGAGTAEDGAELPVPGLCPSSTQGGADASRQQVRAQLHREQELRTNSSGWKAVRWTDRQEVGTGGDIINPNPRGVVGTATCGQFGLGTAGSPESPSQV